MPGQAFDSYGERLLGRRLEKELRAGVEHYVPGQHHAFLVVDASEGNLYELGYVDRMGHAVQVVVVRLADDWTPATLMRCGVATPTRGVELPETVGFELSDAMVAALDAALNV